MEASPSGNNDGFYPSGSNDMCSTEDSIYDNIGTATFSNVVGGGFLIGPSQGGSDDINIPQGANEINNTIKDVLEDVKTNILDVVLKYPTFLTDADKNYQYKVSTDYKYYGLSLDKYESDIMIGKETVEDHSGNSNFELINTVLENIGITNKLAGIEVPESSIKIVSSTQYSKTSVLFIPDYSITYTIVPVIAMVNFDSSLTSLDAEPKMRLYSLIEYGPSLIRDCIVYFILKNYPNAVLPLTSLSAEFLNMIHYFEKIPSFSESDLSTIRNVAKSISNIRDLSIMFRTAMDVLRKQTIMNIPPQELAMYMSTERSNIKPIMMKFFDDHINRITKLRTAIESINCFKTVMNFTYSDYNIAGKFSTVDTYNYRLSSNGIVEKESKNSQTVATESIIKIARLLKQPVVYPSDSIKCDGSPNENSSITSNDAVKLTFPTPDWDSLTSLLEQVSEYDNLKSVSKTVEIKDISIDDIATLDEEYDEFNVNYNGRSFSGTVTVSGIISK